MIVYTNRYVREERLARAIASKSTKALSLRDLVCVNRQMERADKNKGYCAQC